LADDPRLQALAERAARRPREGAWLARLGWPGPALFGGLGLLAAGLAAGALLWIQPFGQTYDTSVGERRAISLEDGSTVELNTDSRVRVRLGKTERRLELLKGQAMFAVAHDASRPFIVTAGDTAVRAVGTKFEVYRTGGAVRVILTEGRVQVSRSGQTAKPVTMTAGERVEAAPGEALKAAPVDVAAATGWTQGRLTFQDAPLAQAVAEVNRYSRRHVVLGAGAPTDERVNGVFDAGDTEAFAHGVATMLDLTAARRADGAIELTGRRPA
jgi:transmembrane sensor